MAIEVIGKENIGKEKTCHNCGSRLKYLPIDVQVRIESDYTGCKEAVRFITCPCCNKQLYV